MVIGFMDERLQKLWSFHKPEISKNTTNLRANTFGFYSINGSSVVDFKPKSRKEDVCEFFQRKREENGKKRIAVILDNFPSHMAKKTQNFTDELGIDLVFLLPYSPDLNPIEFIWKSIKRVISGEFILNTEHMKSIISSSFELFPSKLSFARWLIERFLERDLKYKILGCNMYIGLDVHKKSSYYSMVDDMGREVKNGRFSTTCEDLEEFASDLPEDIKVAIEASTSGIFAYECLDEKGIEVHLAHPALVKPFAKKHVKTDKVDSKVLAQLLRINYLLWGSAPRSRKPCKGLELCPRERDKRSKNDREA